MIGLFTSKASANTWTSKTDLNQARYRHTATLLNDGKLFVVGGEYSGYSLFQTEIYNPATNVWNPVAQPNTRKEYHTANLVTVNASTGATKVMVAGGLVNGVAYNSADLYDPVTNSWSYGNMLANRLSHASSLLNDGRLLITGGVDSTNTVLNSAELYDPVANIWSSTVGFTIARRLHAQVSYKDALGNYRVMVIGGLGAANTDLNSTELYDPVANTWYIGPNLNYARSDFSAVKMNDGRILVIG